MVSFRHEFAVTFRQILQLSYTINSGLLANPELKSLLGSQLARNLHQVLPAMHSEMTNFVDELIPSEDNGMCFAPLDISIFI